MAAFERVTYDDSMVSKVYDLAHEGMDNADIASALGLTRRELSAWRRTYREFDNAIEAGRGAAMAAETGFTGENFGGSYSTSPAVPILGLDFAAGRYSRSGSPIASPLTFTRSTAAWSTAVDGITVTAYAINAPRITARGLYLETARSRLSTYPTDQNNWAIVSTATKAADTAIGLLTPVIIGSGGSTASMLSSNTTISLTAGQKVAVKGVYKAGTSGRARFRVQQAGVQSTVVGLVGQLAVLDEGAGVWSNIRNTELGNGWFMFEGVVTAGATGVDYRLREGPDSAVSGQTAIFAWSELTDEADPGEIILGTQATGQTTAADVATVDLTNYSGVTGFAIRFTAGALTTDAVIHQVESAAGTSYVQLRYNSTGDLVVTSRVLGVDGTSITLAGVFPDQQYSVAVEWRNGALSALLDGSANKRVESLAGPMPPITLARLFSSGGTNLVVPVVNYYNTAL